jgi:hypothetical protein
VFVYFDDPSVRRNEFEGPSHELKHKAIY